MGLLVGLSWSDVATTYTFTKIVDTSGPFDAFGGEPSINDAGTVAFQGEYKAGGEGVFSGRGGPITIIADSNGTLNGFGGITSINVHGTVAFRATFDTGGDGIFKGDGGPITTIADASGSFASFITDGPWINDDGTVAFFATLDTGEEGIFKGNGASITTIADASGPFASFGIYPSINSAGTVVFFATFDAGGAGIFTSNGGPLTTIADTSGPFASFDDRRLSLDDEGVVTFSATLDMGGSGWFIGNGGTTTQIADPETTFRAIVQSNPLFSGATVLHSPYQGRNASGQYAFFVRFADGSEAIYRADPIPRVAELASLGPVTLWIGLKNSDDQGTSFDLRAEVYLKDESNNTLVASGQTLCIAGVTRNPEKAKEAIIPFDLFPAVDVASGDTLSLKVLVRIGTNTDGTKCRGHSNAVGLRLYYDAINRPSRFGAEIAPDPLEDLFLHSGSSDFLDATAPIGTTAKFMDSPGLNFKNGNFWQVIGIWSMILP
jgi:hypothetical protein